MGIGPGTPTGAVRRRCPVAVGRAAETERVGAVLHGVEVGTAVVAVSGEAGIGKSRLVEVVLDRLDDDVTVRRCGCHLADRIAFAIGELVEQRRPLRACRDEHVDRRRVDRGAGRADRLDRAGELTAIGDVLLQQVPQALGAVLEELEQ